MTVKEALGIVEELARFSTLPPYAQVLADEVNRMHKVLKQSNKEQCDLDYDLQMQKSIIESQQEEIDRLRQANEELVGAAKVAVTAWKEWDESDVVFADIDWLDAMSSLEEALTKHSGGEAKE